MEENQKSEPKIDKITGAMMIAVAVLFDIANAGINLIPVLGQILAVLISIVGYCTFTLWFWQRGSGVVNPKRTATFFGSGIIEAIPVLNILPAITLGVFLTVSMVQLEDRTGIKLPEKV